MNEIKTIGIIGSGKMGSDLFNYLSDFNFHLIWYTRNKEHQDTLKKTFHKKIKRQLKHGIINHEIFNLKNDYQITYDIKDFANCDLIIESIIEDADIKVELFRKLEKLVKSSCILASNSSSILPSEISRDIKTRNRILGVHFFYPIALKNVVEVISSEYTDEITIEKIKIFLNEIKRFYIVQNEHNAFILNRFLLQLQIRALELMNKYELSFIQMDRIAKKIVAEFGLFEMMDHVGHYTMYNTVLNYSRMDLNKKKYEPLLKELQGRKRDTGTHLFVNTEDEVEEINIVKEREILEELKITANQYFQIYSEEFQINLFGLKKSLEEFCGIML